MPGFQVQNWVSECHENFGIQGLETRNPHPETPNPYTRKPGNFRSLPCSWAFLPRNTRARAKPPKQVPVGARGYRGRGPRNLEVPEPDLCGLRVSGLGAYRVYRVSGLGLRVYRV